VRQHVTHDAEPVTHAVAGTEPTHAVRAHSGAGPDPRAHSRTDTNAEPGPRSQFCVHGRRHGACVAQFLAPAGR
jgi:hypothetical protein